MRFFLINILILIVLFSCRNSIQVTEKLNVIDLYANPGTKIENLSDIVSDIEYIPLQTTDSSYFSEVWGIKVNNGNYYLSTYNYDLLCFDKNGKYLTRLQKNGISYGGYFRDFDINSTGRKLSIAGEEKIYSYDIIGQKFLNRKCIEYKVYPYAINKDNNLPYFPQKISYTPDKENILLSFFNEGEEPVRDLLISTEGKTLDVRLNHYKYKKDEELGFMTTGDVIHYKYGNILHIKELFNDTVFIIDDQSNITPNLILDSHEKHLNTKILSNLSKDRGKMYECFRILDISETPRYLICTVFYKKLEAYQIYDKSLCSYYRFLCKDLLKDDIAGGVNFQPMYSDGNRLYSFVEASVLKKHVSTVSFAEQEVKKPEKKLALKELADSLKETDNLVLIVATPRDLLK